MLKTPLGRFRLIAILEGISYIILVGICMPLKYFADMPEAVKHAGLIHGLLFTLFVPMLAQVYFMYKWSLMKALLAFVSSLVPFGTFILDWKLRKDNPLPESAPIH